MRKKVLALVLFVAMLLALIPGGTANAAINTFGVTNSIPTWQVNGNAQNKGVVITSADVGNTFLSSLGSATAAATQWTVDSTHYNQLAKASTKIATGTEIYLDVATSGTAVKYIVETEASAKPSVGTPTDGVHVYIRGNKLYYDTYATNAWTGEVELADSLYVVSIATQGYSYISTNDQSISATGAWNTIDDYATWYGNPGDTNLGRQYYMSVPVAISVSGSYSIHVNGTAVSVQTGEDIYGTPVQYINVNLLPEAGGNTATATIDFYDSNWIVTTRTITLSFSDTSYSTTANVDLRANLIGKTGNQAANFNARLDGAAIILDVAARTSADITALNANAFGYTGSTATSDEKDDGDVMYRFQVLLQPLKADGTVYDYHTRIYPTAMKIADTNARFLIASANRYLQVSSDPSGNSYEIDADGNILLNIFVRQDDLIDSYIKTNNKLSSASGTTVSSFSFTLGVTGAPKFVFDIVVNNVSRTASTGTLSATELALETGASGNLSVTYPEGAFSTTTTFKAYSDGITVTTDGNTATVTAGATAGTYFVVVTTADNNITIVPVVVTDPAAAVDETAGTYTITGRGVRIRTAPDTSTSKNIAKTTKKGDKVEVTSITDGWALLADGNYISAKYLTKD